MESILLNWSISNELFFSILHFVGLLARKRKEELKRLNDQLRQINEALRRQAKIESYAPSLSYAPPVGRINENEVIVDPKKQQLITTLRTGKNFLRNQDPKMAFAQFKEAFELAQTLEDYLEEKKAARGLGLSFFPHLMLFLLENCRTTSSIFCLQALFFKSFTRIWSSCFLFV